jgi:hypothetical protein
MTERDAPIANLLVLVERHWIDKAFAAIKPGARQELAFGTNAKIGRAGKIRVSYVFFKPTKHNFAICRADFLWLTTIGPQHLRLPGFEDTVWDFHYTFANLRKIAPIPITHFHYFSNGNQLRNTARTSCLVADPQPELSWAA